MYTEFYNFTGDPADVLGDFSFNKRHKYTLIIEIKISFPAQYHNLNSRLLWNSGTTADFIFTI